MDLGPFETRSQLSIWRRNQSLPVASLLILLSLPRESQSEIRRGKRQLLWMSLFGGQKHK